MIAAEPIKLPDIDNYVEDLAAIAEKANKALNLCLRARMAVSAGAQHVAYAHLAQVGTLLAEIYQAGDANETNTERKNWRLGVLASNIQRAAAGGADCRLQGGKEEPAESA
jgi:hypothetical protein